MQTLIITLALSVSGVLGQEGWSIVGNPLLHAHPCTNESSIVTSYEPGQPPGEENQYYVLISKSVPKYTQINLKFDIEAVVMIDNSTQARITTTHDDVFNLRFFGAANSVGFLVKGPANGAVPYFESIQINNVEYCKNPLKGYLDSYISGYKVTAETHSKAPDGKCGRRKISHTELIVNGADTKPGDWPWHAAIYRTDRATAKYICGGTILSKHFVLTAAHCTTLRGEPILPEILNVVLGKYNLYGGDLETQEKQVHEVLVHEGFVRKQLDNDIALLKLKSEVTFGDYVQPACLWYPTAVDKLPSDTIKGTVVGWGFDQNNALSTELRQATMPVESEVRCIKKNPLFYSKILDSKKFCAGLNNGTSACNGDSGGGFHVFVPDSSGDASADASGAWYVYGIVSLSVSRRDVALCDPTQYVVFTKIAEYRGWILKYVQ
ncbi:unnamed protein product, partial [Iphiclides podalirius]